MANRRVLVKRRKAARNIRKITRTMQLIATARFQSAYSRAVASKPYTEKLAELVSGLARAAEGIDHPLMKTHDDVSEGALLVLTSTRGLCGGYNANVLRASSEHLDAQSADGRSTSVHMVGKKGISFFRFSGRQMTAEIDTIGETPAFEQVEPIANGLMDAFVRGEISSVHVAYMKFISTSRQVPVVEQILPLSTDLGEEEESSTQHEYEFSPSPDELLNELLPATVRVRIFQAFTDAAVSEQVARMVAMKAATDAAGDMIKRLTRQYNRARQTQITMELLDIVGGANALG